MYISISIYVYIYIYICIYLYISLYIFIFLYINIYLFTYIYINIYLYVSMYLLSIFLYIYISIDLCISNQFREASRNTQIIDELHMLLVCICKYIYIYTYIIHHLHNIINTTTSSTLYHLHCIIKHNLSVISCRRCSTRSTSREVRGSPATIEYHGRRLLLRGRCSTWRISALGASECHFVWQVQHSEHLQRGLLLKSGNDCSPMEQFGLLLRGRCSTRSTSERSAEVRRRLSTMDAGCFCVAGAALGGPQSHFAWQVQHSQHLQRGLRKSGDDWVLWTPAAFAWQVQHSEHLSVILRGICSTWSISLSLSVCVCQVQHLEILEVRWRLSIVYYGRRLLLRGRCSTCRISSESPETIEYYGRRLNLCGRCSTRSTSAEVRRRLTTADAVCVCMAGAALGAPQCHFAWQVQHLEHLSLILRGRCSTRSTSSGSPATIEYYGRRLLLRGRCSTWSTSFSFCVTCAALGAPPSHFAWQVQQLEQLSVILRGRRSTWSTWVSFCVAGAALEPAYPSAHLHNTIYTTSSNTSSSTRHHLHYIINTTSSTQPHTHITVYIILHTPFTQHHPHSTIYTTFTTSSHTGRCSTWSTAILPLLPHSCWYPSCYSSLWLVLCSVSLTYSTLGCPKALLTCGVVIPAYIHIYIYTYIYIHIYIYIIYIYILFFNHDNLLKSIHFLVVVFTISCLSFEKNICSPLFSNQHKKILIEIYMHSFLQSCALFINPVSLAEWGCLQKLFNSVAPRHLSPKKMQKTKRACGTPESQAYGGFCVLFGPKVKSFKIDWMNPTPRSLLENTFGNTSRTTPESSGIWNSRRWSKNAMTICSLFSPVFCCSFLETTLKASEVVGTSVICRPLSELMDRKIRLRHGAATGACMGRCQWLVPDLGPYLFLVDWNGIWHDIIYRIMQTYNDTQT